MVKKIDKLRLVVTSFLLNGFAHIAKKTINCIIVKVTLRGQRLLLKDTSKMLKHCNRSGTDAPLRNACYDIHERNM